MVDMIMEKIRQTLIIAFILTNTHYKKTL